jgi:hypothetical protein
LVPQVNSIDVPPPASFKILYHTPFKEAYIHYRFKGQVSCAVLLGSSSSSSK